MIKIVCGLLLTAGMSGVLAAPNAWLSMHASELFSSPIVDDNGETLGRIDQLLLDLRGGRVDYAVLSLEPNGKRFPYPLTAFGPVSGTEKLRLRVDRAALVASTGLAESGATLPPGYRPVRELIGRDVVFRGGERAGELRDLVVNLQTGQIRYAVIDYDPVYPDGSLGVELSEVALPAGEGPVVLAREIEPRPAAGLVVRPSDARRRLQSPFTTDDR